jgi:hypothetical protein
MMSKPTRYAIRLVEKLSISIIKIVYLKKNYSNYLAKGTFTRPFNGDDFQLKRRSTMRFKEPGEACGQQKNAPLIWTCKFTLNCTQNLN